MDEIFKFGTKINIYTKDKHRYSVVYVGYKSVYCDVLYCFRKNDGCIIDLSPHKMEHIGYEIILEP